MTETTSHTARTVGSLFLVGGVLLAVQACGVDSPVSSAEEEGSVPPAGTQLIVPEGAPEDPPPPEMVPRDQLADTPTFTPFTEAPSIANRQEVVAAMEREYPPLLRDAGIGGTVRVYFFIDEEGRVQNRLIDQSSGHEALDRAALAVADVYRFSPARNRDERVPVWVSFPITFRPNGPPS